MPVEFSYGRRRPSFSAWVKFYEAKGCGMSKAFTCAERQVRQGRCVPHGP